MSDYYAAFYDPDDIGMYVPPPWLLLLKGEERMKYLKHDPVATIESTNESFIAAYDNMHDKNGNLKPIHRKIFNKAYNQMATHTGEEIAANLVKWMELV